MYHLRENVLFKKEQASDFDDQKMKMRKYWAVRSQKNVNKCIWRLKTTEAVLLHDMLNICRTLQVLRENNPQNGEFLSWESVKAGQVICPDQKETHVGVRLRMLHSVTTGFCLSSEEYDSTYPGDKKERNVLILK